MSIFSQLIERKITWSQAATQIEGWFSKGFSELPSVAQSDAKQAASSVLGVADTLLGPIIAAGALTVEGAANTGLAALGASKIDPAVDAAIATLGNALKAQVDLSIAQWRAELTPGPQVVMAPVANP